MKRNLLPEDKIAKDAKTGYIATVPVVNESIISLNALTKKTGYIATVPIVNESIIPLDASTKMNNQTQEEVEQIKISLQKTNSLLLSKALPRNSFVMMNLNVGKGSFASVFKGYLSNQKKLNEIFEDKNTVILKKITIENLKLIYPSKEDTSSVADELLLARHILWEMIGLTTVSHPNIITCYGTYYTELNSSPYLVLEYCPNGNMRERIANEKNALSWQKKWQWVYQISLGLKALHNRGIVHRDIKTTNIFLDAEDNAKIGDFGIVSIDSLLLEPGIEAVTAKNLDNMPPDTYKKTNFSKRHDVYALGIVLWELLTGKEPTKRTTSDLSWLQVMAKEKIPDECLDTPQGKFFAELIEACWSDTNITPDIDFIVNKLRESGEMFHPKAAWICIAQELAIQFYPDNQPLSLNYQSLNVTTNPFNQDVDWKAKPIKMEFNSFLMKEPCTYLLTGEAGSGKSSTVYQMGRETLKKCWEWINTNDSASSPSIPYLPILIARHTVPTWSLEALRSYNSLYMKRLSQILPKNNTCDLSNMPWIFIVDGIDELMSEPLNNLQQQYKFELREYLDIPINHHLMITWRTSSAQIQSFYGKDCDDKFFNKNGFLQKFHILPYSQTQALNYLKQSLDWSNDDNEYYKKLMEHSYLRELLANPLILHLLSKIWKTIVDSNINAHLLTRWHIYEAYIKQCFYEYETLFSVNLIKRITEDEEAFTVDDLVNHFMKYCMSDIASGVFEEKNIYEINYSEINHWPENWSEIFQEECEKEFESQEHTVRYLEKESYLELKRRELDQFLSALPLQKRAGRWEFIHKTFSDFAIARIWVDLATLTYDEILDSIPNSIPSRFISDQDGILEFWHEAWRTTNLTMLVDPFFSIIEKSRKNKSLQQPNNYLASNLATLLATVKVPFSGRNLSGVNIPRANLSGAIFYGTTFKKANLQHTLFAGSHLENVNFSSANLQNASFNDRIEVLIGEHINFVLMTSLQQFWVGTERGEILGYKFSGMNYECESRIKTGRDAPILCIKYDDRDGGMLYAATKHNIISWKNDYKESVNTNFEASEYERILDFSILEGSINTVFCAFMENDEAQIVIWDLPTQSRKQVSTGSNNSIIKIVFNINTLISVDWDNRVIFWNLDKIKSDATNEYIIHQFKLDFQMTGCIKDAYFSSDATNVVIVCEKAIYLIDIKTMIIDKNPHEGIIVCGNYDKDRNLLFTAHNNNLIKIWDLNTYHYEIPHQTKDKIVALSYFSKNQLLIIADASKKLTFISTKKLNLKFYGNQNPITNMTYCNEGRLAVVDVSGKIWVWNLLTGNPVKFYDVSENINSLACSGSKLAVGMWDKFKIFDMKEKMETREYILEGAEEVEFVTFPSPDQLLGASSDRLKVVELSNTLTAKSSSSHMDEGYQILNIASTSNGTYLLVRDDAEPDRVRVYRTNVDFLNAKNSFFEFMYSLQGHSKKITHALFCNVSLGATVSKDNTVRLWNLDSTSYNQSKMINKADVSHLAFSKGILAIVNNKNQITLWHTAIDSNKMSLNLSTVEAIRCITFCKASFLAAGSGNHVYVWAKTEKSDWVLLHRLGNSPSLFAKYVCMKNTFVADNVIKPLNDAIIEFEPKFKSYKKWWSNCFWSKSNPNESNNVGSLESSVSDEDKNSSDEDVNRDDQSYKKKKFKN